MLWSVVIWFRPGEDRDLQVALWQQCHSHGDHWSTFIFTQAGKFIPALHHIILNPSKCIYFCPDSKLELDFCITQVQAAAEGLDFALSQGLARGIDSALSHLP